MLLLWLLAALETVGGVPVGVRRPFYSYNPPVNRLEGGAREERTRREIETEKRPKPRPGSPLHAVSRSSLCARGKDELWDALSLVYLFLRPWVPVKLVRLKLLSEGSKDLWKS